MRDKVGNIVDTRNRNRNRRNKRKKRERKRERKVKKKRTKRMRYERGKAVSNLRYFVDSIPDHSKKKQNNYRTNKKGNKETGFKSETRI